MSAGKISSAIKSFLKEREYATDLVQRVAKITYEAEINLVCYTEYGFFLVYFLPDAVRIVVKDRGQGIDDIELAMQEGYSTASDEIRKLGFGAGMGLSNIKKNADHLKIKSVPGQGTMLEIKVSMEQNEGGDSMGVSLGSILEKTGFESLTDHLDREKQISGGYVGDLLSDVNANAKPGNIWVTVLTHPNVAAVAGLKELGAVVIAGGIKPGKEFIDRARQENIPVLITELYAFEVVTILASMGIVANQ